MLSKPNQIAVDRARQHLAELPGYYARSLSAIQRAGSAQQQKAIDGVITADDTWHLFNRSHGCLTAIGGI